MKKCDGGCSINGDCKGEIVSVIVEWGINKEHKSKFNYCEEAIKSDIEAGLRVTIIKENTE